MLTYLDHAATTPISDAAENAWREAVAQLRATPGNPSALHAGGRAAKRLLEDARERVARSLGADKNEVLFTSGATESDALGVMGAARGARRLDPARRRIVVSAVEHDAVAQQEAGAQRCDYDWEVLPVRPDGVSTFAVAEPETVAVASMSLVCAETGVIQPVRELVDEISGRAWVHTDAAQAIGQIPVSYADLGVDLLTVGGHKIGAPVGVGALVASRAVTIDTDRAGGGQERKIRSGTVDVAGACALAAALADAVEFVSARAHHYEKLREHLLAGLPPEVHATTTAPSSPAIVHLSLPTAHPEILLLKMDEAGVMVSAGSACHAGVTRPSEVLLRMGRNEREALGVLRVSFGPENTKAEVHRFLRALPEALAAAQNLDRRDQ